MVSDPHRTPHRRETRVFCAMMLVLLAAIGSAGAIFVDRLNVYTIFGFPLGYFAVSHGSLILAIVAIFWFANRQYAIDRKTEMAEWD